MKTSTDTFPPFPEKTTADAGTNVLAFHPQQGSLADLPAEPKASAKAAVSPPVAASQQAPAPQPSPAQPQPANPAQQQLNTALLWVHAMVDAAVLVNAKGKILGINRFAARYLGTTPDALMGHCWPDFLLKRHQPRYLSLVDSALKELSSPQHGLAEVSLIKVNGELKDVELTVSRLPLAEPTWLVLMRDLSFYKEECLKLHTLASTDALTALPNRRFFDQQLQQLWQECQSKQSPLSVLVIDVDFFKQFNDEHGHVQGDECLRRVAAAISLALPAGVGLVARYGGEEFAMLLPHHNAELAQQVALNVQRKVQQLDFSEQGLSAEVTVSVSQGIATESRGLYPNAQALLAAADTALYRAKSEGRDRIGQSC
ncbi:diguanylate cyclase [Rheinheimera sp.]|uniref:sensor domain-containing diguanylate cyclase n=1 Tax=Rheinheimera sp. TaxID=1869214 RepID=UPI00307F8FD2